MAKGSDFDVETSSLDERTHREMLLLYEEASRAILFAKSLQWRTVTGTLITLGVFVVLAKFATDDPDFPKFLVGALIVLRMASVLIFSLYQFWQHNEHRKLVAISTKLSNLFRAVRHVKSARESNVHRYLLLAFMYLVIVADGGLCYLGIQGVSRYL